MYSTVQYIATRQIGREKILALKHCQIVARVVVSAQLWVTLFLEYMYEDCFKYTSFLLKLLRTV